LFVVNTEIYMSAWIDDQVDIAVRGFLYAENVKEIKYPRDWWQAVKERWLPDWLRRRFPVVYVRVNIKAIYQNFRPSLPNENHALFVDAPVEFTIP
jgi:hypothetical protein